MKTKFISISICKSYHRSKRSMSYVIGVIKFEDGTQVNFKPYSVGKGRAQVLVTGFKNGVLLDNTHKAIRAARMLAIKRLRLYRYQNDAFMQRTRKGSR